MTRLLALLPVVLALSGCNGCSRDRPYVPYVVGDESAPRSGDGGHVLAALEAGDDAGTLALEPALVAPLGLRTWVARGVPLDAGEGRELALALMRDIDGDGRDDALVVTRPAGGAQGAVDLVLARGGAPTGTPNKRLAVGPALRASDACVPVARLERIGSRSAFAEIGVHCQRGGSSRAVVVARLGPSADLAFDARVDDPEGAPRLALDADGADRDSDGIDDVALRLTLDPMPPPFEPTPRVSARLAFFDRPAGASRAADEPEASLRMLTSPLLARAKGKDAAQVGGAVAQVRALYRAMCAEGGAPRLVKPRGGALVTCGLSKPLEDAGIAEVRALASLGDGIQALAAADGAQRAPAARTATRAVEIESALATLLKPAAASEVRELRAPVDASSPRHPAWGALAFTREGKLLVRSGARLTEVDVESGEAKASEAAAWPAEVSAMGSKLRFLEAYHACEGGSLRATFSPTGGDGEMREVFLPIAPPLGARCASGRGDQASVVPIAFGDRGLEALVAGQLLLFPPDGKAAMRIVAPLDVVGPPGSPRSPGGRVMALGTTRGIYVRESREGQPTRQVLVRNDALTPYADLRACTAADDGVHVACVSRGRVLLVTLER